MHKDEQLARNMDYEELKQKKQKIDQKIEELEKLITKKNKGYKEKIAVEQSID